MTTQPAPLPPDLAVVTATATTAIAPLNPLPRLTLLPDPPHPPDMVNQLPDITRAQDILGYRYRHRPDVLVCGDAYLRYRRYRRARARRRLASPRPDCMVAFGLTDITPDDIMDANGYTISEVGKPPEFVLEVASAATGRRDYTVKREIYARFKVFEYWRFDRTGGRFHNAALAGDRLSEDGTYEPIPVREQRDGVIRGHSAALDLELRWVEGELYLWDPATQQYLLDYHESRVALAAAEAARDAAEAARDAAQAEAQAEAAARQQAQARIRQLEAQLAALRQSQNP